MGGTIQALNSNISSCSPGSISLSGRVPCTSCPNGTYTNGGGATVCLPCFAGSFCRNTTSHPSPCPMNTFSSDNATSCTLCTNTSYTVKVGSSECKTCPPGFQCLKSGVNTQCLPGTYNPGGRNTKCLQCKRGYISYTGDSECEPCLPDQYSPDNKVCTWCHVGHIVDDKRTGCISCNKTGQYTDDGLQCKTCPVGKRLDKDAGGCTSCPRGSFSNNYRTCTQCPPGFFTHSSGSTTCTQCPRNFFTHVAGSTTCVPCPPHSHSSVDKVHCRCNSKYHLTVDHKECIPISTAEVILDDVDEILRGLSHVRYEPIPDYFDDSDLDD
jgi:hypothetical protein